MLVGHGAPRIKSSRIGCCVSGAEFQDCSRTGLIAKAWIFPEETQFGMETGHVALPHPPRACEPPADPLRLPPSGGRGSCRAAFFNPHVRLRRSIPRPRAAVDFRCPKAACPGTHQRDVSRSSIPPTCADPARQDTSLRFLNRWILDRFADRPAGDQCDRFSRGPACRANKTGHDRDSRLGGGPQVNHIAGVTVLLQWEHRFNHPHFQRFRGQHLLGHFLRA